MESKKVLEYLETFNRTLIPSIRPDELEVLISDGLLSEVKIDGDPGQIKEEYTRIKAEFIKESEKLREAKNFLLWKEQEVKQLPILKKLAFKMSKSNLLRAEFEAAKKNVSEIETKVNTLRDQMMATNQKLEILNKSLIVNGRRVQLTLFGKDCIDELKVRPNMLQRDFKEFLFHLKSLDAAFETILKDIDDTTRFRQFPRSFGLFAVNIGGNASRIASSMDQIWQYPNYDEFEEIILLLLGWLYGVQFNTYKIPLNQSPEYTALLQFSQERNTMIAILNFFEQMMQRIGNSRANQDPIIDQYVRTIRNNTEFRSVNLSLSQDFTQKIRNDVSARLKYLIEQLLPKPQIQTLYGGSGQSPPFLQPKQGYSNIQNQMGQSGLPFNQQTNQMGQPGQITNQKAIQTQPPDPNNPYSKIEFKDLNEKVISAFLLSFAKQPENILQYREILKFNIQEIGFFAALATLLPWSVEKSWCIVKRAQNIIMKSKEFRFIPEMLEMAFLMCINQRILELEDEVSLEDLIKLRYFTMPIMHITSLYIMFPVIEKIVRYHPMSYIVGPRYRRGYYRSSLHYRGSSVHYHSVG